MIKAITQELTNKRRQEQINLTKNKINEITEDINTDEGIKL